MTMRACLAWLRQLRGKEPTPFISAFSVGGIDRNTNPHWRNNLYDAEKKAAAEQQKRDAMMKDQYDGPLLSDRTYGGSGSTAQGTDASTNIRQYRQPTQIVVFVFRNWKGRIAERRVVPINIEFTCDGYHGEAKWILHGIDIDKGVRRSFAFENMLTPIKAAR